ncbi:thermonuclease family protein [Actinomycetospora sp. CA-101289]|uniref:thermonuclease family protein n=1 Tax=Actinomycetospora sp. CA-101289 TaxID=3239893 RepID=UPI003D976837
MSKKGWAIGVVAFLAVVGSCNQESAPTTPVSPAAAPAVTTTAPSSTAPVLPTTTPRPAGETVAVTRVIDGDTFEIAGGRRVQVLGIDSCEIGTYGGTQAKESAGVWLDGRSVVLEQEPGVDRDEDGRLLRYVSTTDGSDLGETMVAQSHTGVDEDDASATRIADLRAQDYTGRDCSAPEYAPSTSQYDVDVDLEDDDDGLPDGALTGGYCARKWWC